MKMTLILSIFIKPVSIRPTLNDSPDHEYNVLKCPSILQSQPYYNSQVSCLLENNLAMISLDKLKAIIFDNFVNHKKSIVQKIK